MFKSIFSFLGVILLGGMLGVCEAKTVTDVYTLRMYIETPRVFNNTTSQGYRQYTNDYLVGELHITYSTDNKHTATIEIKKLKNKSYIIGGKYVTYTVALDWYAIPRVNMIGDNKKDVFKTPSVAFDLICDPSYNIGGIEEDNSLYIRLGGTGTVSKKLRGKYQVIKTLKGNLAGTLGCGCTEYGHISPTRINGYKGPIKSKVDDVAAVWGTWSAKWKKSYTTTK